MARVYYEKGKMEDCIAALRRALELNPGFVEAQKFLHWCQTTPPAASAPV
ncbi:MAG: hypothetical protein AB7D57_03580 [Desulfovibrionaceae bacterium]